MLPSPSREPECAGAVSQQQIHGDSAVSASANNTDPEISLGLAEATWNDEAPSARTGKGEM